MSAFSGRKIIASVVCLGAGGLSVYFKSDVPPGFLSLLQTLFITFVAGNSTEHITNAIGLFKKAEGSSNV